MATETTAATERELLTRWQQRCREGRFSPAVAGTRTLRVFGTSGDEAMTLPRVAALADLELLEADERFALDYAERVVAAKTQQRRSAFLVPQDSRGTGTPMRRFSPLEGDDILVLSAISGG